MAEELLLLSAMLLVTQQVSPFREAISHTARRLRQGKIRRGSLLPPSRSAFMYLFNSSQDDALVTLCGFDHNAFNALWSLFDPLFRVTYLGKDGRIRIRYNDVGKKPRGRRRLIDGRICLGLVLAWTRTKGQLHMLQLIFGLTASWLSVWLRMGVLPSLD